MKHSKIHKRKAALYFGHLVGQGIFNRIYHALRGPRNQAPPDVRNFIDKHMKSKIIGLEVGKTPIDRPISQFLNAVSKGKFEEARRAAGYNDINHAYMIVTLDNGEKYRIEKNHVVEISKYKPNKDEIIEVQLEQPLSVGNFLSNAEHYQKNQESRPNFWKYDAGNNNCQYFVDDVIKGNAKDINNTAQVNEFAVQPEAFNTIKEVRPIVDAATDLAGRFDILLHGEGLKQRKKRKQYRKKNVY